MSERECKVCTLEANTRAELEAAFRSGVPLRSIGSKYGMSHTSVRRHVENHLHEKPAPLVPEVVEALPPDEREKTFYEKFLEIDRYIDAQLKEAQASRSPMVVATFIKESRAMLEMRYRLNIERMKLEAAKALNPESTEAAALSWLRENEPAVYARYLGETQAARESVA
jgi:hypothetical protein